MKKLLFILAAVIMLFLATAPVAASTDSSYIIDETGTLTNSQIEALNEKADTLSQKRKCGVYIYIVDLVPEEYAETIDDVEIYIEKFYKEHGLGYGDDKNGMVLLLEIGDEPGERDYLFYTHGSCKSIFSDNTRETLLDEEIVPLFREAFNNGNFYKVADTFLDQVKSEFSFFLMATLGIKLAVVILVPILIAWIICSKWKSKMKTANIARTADNYIPKNGFNLTNQTDQFLYRTTIRTRIEQSSSSSSGGSSSSSSGSSSGGKV